MFFSLLGHDRIKRQLTADIESRNFHQAYLFSGPEHVGKMALVKEFISELRFSKPFDADSPFGHQFEAGQGPGFLGFFDHGESLKVEEIRLIADFVMRRTSEHDISCCVLEHAERMTRSAANAFLKILEEPSERFSFFITTREEQKLLSTIRSRCQVYRFAAIPKQQVEDFLRLKIKNEIFLQEFMKLSGGRPGLAIPMIEDKAFLERMRSIWDYAMLIFEKDIIDRFDLAEHIASDQYSDAERSQFLTYLAMALQKEGVWRKSSQLDHLQRVKRLFQDTQVNKRMCLENLFLTFE